MNAPWSARGIFTARSFTLTHALLVALAITGMGLIYLLPPRDVLVLVAGAVAMFVILRQPMYGLCALALAVPWGSTLSVGAHAVPLTPTDLLAFELGVAWLVDAVVQRRAIFADTVLLPYLGLYLVAIVMSVTQASDVAASGREVVKWLEFGEVYFVGVWYLHSRGHLRVFSAALVLGGVSQAMLGFVQFVQQAGPAAFGLHRAFFRSYGSFDQPNPYAGYLNMIIPIAAVMSWKADLRWERRSYRCAAAVMVLALLASQSRGALLSGMVAAAVLSACLFSATRWVFRVGLTALCATALGTTFGLVSSGPMLRVLSAVGLGDVAFGHVTDANFSAVERAAHWLAGLRMFAAHPILGVGIGNYGAAYPTFHPRGWYASLQHAHNYYINIAAEAGILGLTTYTLVVGAALWYSYAIVRRTRDNVCLALAAGALGALVATSFHNLFDVLYVHGMATLLGSILALAPAGQYVDRASSHGYRMGNGQKTEIGSHRQEFET